jgi:ribA/ribD-fused uncharacterized protein
MKEPILTFRGPTRWLSNFHLSPVKIDGILYPSVEHAYMAQKCADPNWKNKCQDSTVPPAEIKKLSYGVSLIPGWDEIRLSTMKKCLQSKFSISPLKERLLETGDVLLQEGNTWGDKFWGIDQVTGEGENHLGKLLMEVREELRNI